MSEKINYANILAHKVTLDTSIFNLKDAVTKEYVDTQMNNLIDNAPEVLDTLGEIVEFLGPTNSGEVSNTILNRLLQNQKDIQEVSEALVTEITQLDDKLNDEIHTRESQVSSLETSLNTEVYNREQDVLKLVTDLSKEVVTRNDEISSLRTEIHTLISTVMTQRSIIVSMEMSQKFDKGPGYYKRDDGDFAIRGDSQLYIGEDWRIKSVNNSGIKRLQFEYSNDGGATWSIGIPFVRTGMC